MDRIRVVIADDHQLVRDGLRSMMEKEPDISVVGEAGCGRSAEAVVRETDPHVVVMDVNMPDLNGIETTRSILRARPGIRVVALSGHADDRFVLEMMSAGASAYILKDAAYPELIRAIRDVVCGRKCLSPQVARPVVDAFVRLSASMKKTTGVWKLSPREREVAGFVSDGKTTKEVAALLGISGKTVEAHRRKVMEKLGVRTVADLTKLAIREGLTSSDG